MSTNQLELAYNEIKSKYYNKLQGLTKPLRDFFQIPYFSYQKVYIDGRYSLLADRPDFLEHYLDKRFYAYDPFLVSPYSYHEGRAVHIISDEFCNFDDATKSTIDEIAKKFGFYESILILIKSFDYYEIFVFSTSVQGRKGVQLFFSHYDLIDKFISYFRNQMRNELNEVHDMGINLSDFREMDYKNSEIINTRNNSTMRDEFIKCVSPEEYELAKTMKTLTSREGECLYWITNGKTSDEIAQILNISRRTVECFRDKCRVKFGSHYSFANLIYKLGKYKLLS